jgi:hypothetical protein
LRDQRVRVRELVGLELRIDDSAIHAYIEDAACASNQSRFHPEGAFELGSQTGRRGQVVSGTAVADADIHGQVLEQVMRGYF